MSELFLIRDTDGEVFAKVLNPAIVMDKEFGLLLKIGEYKDMEEFYALMYEAYASKAHLHESFTEMAKDLALLSLPKDQEEIDKVFNIADYAGTLYKRLLAEGVIK